MGQGHRETKTIIKETRAPLRIEEYSRSIVVMSSWRSLFIPTTPGNASITSFFTPSALKRRAPPTTTLSNVYVPSLLLHVYILP